MTDPLSRDEIRKRHQSWEITDTGSPLDVCDRCQADWPCDAIRLADEVEQRRKDSERLAAKVVTDAEEITRLREALEFYASEENYDDEFIVGNLVTTGWNADRMEECEEWEPDNGRIARAALENSNEKA